MIYNQNVKGTSVLEEKIHEKNIRSPLNIILTIAGDKIKQISTGGIL